MANDGSGFSSRDLSSLPFAARLVLAAFLLSVGAGYVAALVQLHFQGASAGSYLPTEEDVVATYYGKPRLSQLERLLTADENRPFNGSGSMRAAFTSRSGGLQRAVRDKAQALGVDSSKPEGQRQAKAALLGEREGERQLVLAWIRSGKSQRHTYESDQFPIPAGLQTHALTPKYFDPETSAVRIQSLFNDRCARCHAEAVGGSASNYPLDSFERINDYCHLEAPAAGMSLPKLAQTTHVHLLSFAMLYGLTGLLFALSSYPLWLRCSLAPLPLLAQMADIACWWLGRLHPAMAAMVRYTGGIVGIALVAQIFLTCFSLFGRRGKVILMLSVFVCAGAGYYLERSFLRAYVIAESAGDKESDGAD